MRLTGNQKRLLAGAILFFACFLVYIPALRAGFAWNDDTFFWNNPNILSSKGLFTFWFTSETPDYFPLTSSILWLEWRIFGMDHVWGYHAVNVLLHAISCLFLWRLLEQFKIRGAWFAALVFGIHPVNVEAVAWITQLKTTLPMALSLLSALLFFKSRAIEDAAPARPAFRIPLYWLSLLCFLLALLSKTSVVLLPAVLLLLTWWRSGALTRRDFFRVAPFFAIAGGLALVTIWFQYNRAIQNEIVREDGYLSRLVIAGRAFWFYLSKALLPFKLIFVYPRWSANPANPIVYLPLAALLALLSFLWRARSQPWARGAFTALAIYVAMLFPVLGFFNIYFMRYSLVADHWQYHAIPAIIALAVSVANLERWRKPALLRGIAIPVAILLATLTWRQAGTYHDEETLLRATIARNPGAFMAHHNLGLLLANRGDVTEALAHLRKTVELQPNHAKAYSSLASTLRQNGETGEAIVHYAKALEIEPDFVEGVFNLGNALLEAGRFDEAIAVYRQAVQMTPDFGPAHNNLGIALRETGDRFGARTQFEAALKIDPEHLTALNNLAWLLATAPEAPLRDGARAIELSLEANRITRGNDPGVLEILAAAYAEAGQFDAAAHTTRQAIDLARARGDAPFADRIHKNLELYLSGTPFRDNQGAR